jgi:hypothetical protein
MLVNMGIFYRSVVQMIWRTFLSFVTETLHIPNGNPLAPAPGKSPSTSCF